MAKPTDVILAQLPFTASVRADMIIAFTGEEPICVKDRYSPYNRAGFYRVNEAIQDTLLKAKANNMAVLITLVPLKEKV